MILEYLVSVNDLPQIESIGNDAELFKTKLTDDMFIIRYVITPDDEEAAKKLSEINEKTCNKIKPVVLVNESSEFYNSWLYRIESQFEYKLRKILKIVYRFMPAEEQKKYSFVESLDGAKLLTLFDRLFDDHFPDKIKEVLEKKKWKVSYEELLTIVKEGKPFTYWDNLFPNQTPIFKEQHNYIRDGIRNKIMHFYPINREKFEKAKQTLLVVNQELDNLLQNMENGKFVFDDSFIRLMEEYEQQMNLNSDTYFADDSYDTWLADD